MTIEQPLWLQNLDYSARMDRGLIARIARLAEGVYDGLTVAQDGSGTFNVVVAIGAAVIAGDDETSQGSYYVECSAAETVACPASPGSGTRTDTVIFRVNDAQAGSVATPADAGVIEVIEGTTVPDTAIALATIARTDVESAIFTAAITDVRNVIPDLIIGDTVQAHSTVLDNTTASFTVADESKLDNFVSVPAGTTISAFGASLIDDATAAAGRTTLGLDPIISDIESDIVVLDTRLDNMDTSWLAITLTAPWANSGGSWQPAESRFTGTGLVHVRGVINGGVSTGSTITTFAGSRIPRYLQYHTCSIGTSGGSATIYLEPSTGRMVYYGPASPSSVGFDFFYEAS